MTTITWLGHSTVLIHTRDQRLLTDPVLRGGIGPIRRRIPRIVEDLTAVDAVLVSHLHHDHLDLPSLRTLPRGLDMVVPRGAAKILPSTVGRIHEVSPSESVDLGSVTIRAVHAEHDGRRLPFGPSGPALGYVVDGDHRIYFAGDTAVFSAMADLATGLDCALLPVGGWGPTLRGRHMDPLQAAEALRLLQPRAAIPIHWGSLWPIGLSRIRRDRFEGPAEAFRVAAGRVAPDVAVQVLEPGATFEL